jgi:hypothetical protein
MKIARATWWLWLLAAVLPARSGPGGERTAGADRFVLLEAEAFDNLGGWLVDQQFMDQMGSPYLLAHGLGTPVADATTKAKLPTEGTYRVWVRTRDWVAPWKATGAPGRFQVLVDGKPLAAVFGAEGAEWHWQDGGLVEIAGRQTTVGLHDLTGFEGRCDAVFLSRDLEFLPPNSRAELAEFRRRCLGLPDRPAEAGRFDLVVVGGGIAGMTAALSAARLGLDVALVQDRPVLGGNNSSEVRVWLGGEIQKSPYPHVGDVVHELEPRRKGQPGTAEMYEDQKRIAIVRAEQRIRLFLNVHVNRVEKEGDRIAAVAGQDIRTARPTRLAGRWFADCTGDATLGWLAGADCDMTLEGHMGASNLWAVENTGRPAAFPRCPWAVELSGRPLPSRLDQLGVWFWESGFDRHPIADLERVRDTNFRAMYGAWDALKNQKHLYPNHRLSWAAYVAGTRESRRLLGDLMLSREDLLRGTKYPDGCVPTSWTIDLHLADPHYVRGFEEDPFLAVASRNEQYGRPYWVPYRCLYSRNVPNLFMAGRNISVTHEALGTTRVMRTTGMMGEIVGMAAEVCKRFGTDPRAVYQNYLPELKKLMERGTGKRPPGAGG